MGVFSFARYKLQREEFWDKAEVRFLTIESLRQWVNENTTTTNKDIQT